MKYCFIWVKILYHYSSWLLIKQLWKEFERYKENVNALINPSSNEHWIYSHLSDSLYVYFDLFLHKQVNSLSYWESFSSNLDLPNMVGGSSDVTKYIKKYYALKTSRCVLKFIAGQSHLFFRSGFSFADADNSQDNNKKEGIIFISLSNVFCCALGQFSPISSKKRTIIPLYTCF